MNKPTHIHGSPITAALLADIHHKGIYKERITRVWCEDGSLHLVTGYEARTLAEFPCFDTVVGYWEIPEGQCYLSPTVKESITRPSFLSRA